MNAFIRRSLHLSLIVGTLALPAQSRAQVEIEVDPIAYALGGYSFHVARVLGPTRLNIGVFGLQLSSSIHGNEGWTSRMRGTGIKWDYVGATSDGLFLGIDGGYMRTRYSLDSTAQSERRGIVGIGARGGYRLPIGTSGLYIAPWASASYNFDGKDVQVGGSGFKRRAVEIFPTVHLGWRF